MRARLSVVWRDDTTTIASARPLTAAWNAPSTSAAPLISRGWTWMPSVRAASLSFPQLVIRVIRVQENTDASDRGRRLLQELDPLSGEIRGEEGDTCHVAAGPSQTGHQPALDRIGAVDHHDGNRLRRALGEWRHVSTESKDDVRLALHQFDSKVAKALGLPFCVAKLEDKILPFDVAQFLQSLTKGGQVGVGGAQEKNAQPGYPRRLRLGGEWREKKTNRKSNREPDQPHGHLGRMASDLSSADESASLFYSDPAVNGTPVERAGPRRAVEESADSESTPICRQ